MNDLARKRAVGVIVLILIGVLIPLFVTRCMHGGDDDSGRGAMRVYNVQPNGQAEPATGADNDNRYSKGTNPRQASGGYASSQAGRDVPKPDTVSPQSPSSFSTPPVHGTSGASSRVGNGAGSQNGASQSAPPNGRKPANGAGGSEAARRSGSGPSSQSGSGGALENRHPSGWIVQTASFGQRDSAVALARKLNQRFSASFTPAHVNGKTWYRVSVGPFDSKKAAQSAAGRLKKQGQSALVRHLP